MNRWGWLAVSGLAVLGTGCGLATHVRPVPKGRVQLEASVGGPMADVGAPIPLPLSTVGASYGLLDRMDVHGHVHLTPLAFFNVPGLDVGATYLALEEQGSVPAVAVTSRLYAFSNLRDGTLTYGDLSATASWLLARRWLTYGSLTGMVDFLDGRFMWSPAIGEQVLLGSWSLQLEARYYDPTYRSASSAVHWVSAGGYGAFGVVLGAGFRFGGS